MSRVTLHLESSSLGLDRFFQSRLVEEPSFAAPELDEDARGLARRAWEDRARAEYIGVMVMRRFHGLLVDINAPIDLQELALRLTLQEQEHTALCMAAARTFGADGEVTFDVQELQQARTDAPLAAMLLDMICGTFCTGEVVALELISHSIDALPDSSYRDVLRRIARDEVLHARIGPALLTLIRTDDPDWCPYPGDEWIETCIGRYQTHMRTRDVIEPDEAAAFEEPRFAAQLTTAGIPPSIPFKRAYLDAIDHAVPKALARAGVAPYAEENR